RYHTFARVILATSAPGTERTFIDAMPVSMKSLVWTFRLFSPALAIHHFWLRVQLNIRWQPSKVRAHCASESVYTSRSFPSVMSNLCHDFYTP
ncbi:TPA: hypothetical protein ACW4H8_004690, partial [Salmonella enterica]